MAIKRHLVGGRGIRDRVDAYGSDAMSVKKIARGAQDALARWGLRGLCMRVNSSYHGLLT
jgi:hypothetical protein